MDDSSALLETRDLLLRGRNGEQDAIDRLFARYRGRLERFVRSRLSATTRVHVDAADVVQDVLVRACSAIDRFEWRGIGSFWAFLRQIALRRIITEGELGAREQKNEPLP